MQDSFAYLDAAGRQAKGAGRIKGFDVQQLGFDLTGMLLR
jgi:hypothetical protein